MGPPPKYALEGIIAAVTDEFYSVPGPTAGCGVCYEIYGPNGIQTAIIGDYEPAGYGTSWTLQVGGLWQKLTGLNIGSGFGNAPMAVRQVTCPSNIVSGTVHVQWSPQKYQSNNFWFQLHVDNSIVGITSIEIQSGKKGHWINMTREYVDNWFTFDNHGEIAIPFNVRVTSIYGQTLTKSVSGTSILDIAYPPDGSGAPTFIDMGAQFPTPDAHKGKECCPPAQPADIYIDALWSATVTDGAAWRDWGSYQVTGLTYTSGGAKFGKYCIGVTIAQWGAVQIGTDTPFVPTDFTAITFYIKGTSTWTGLGLLWVGVDITGKEIASTQLKGPTVTTSWQPVTIDLTKFKKMPTLIRTFQFQANTNSPQLYIDQIVLTGGNGCAHYYPDAIKFDTKMAIPAVMTGASKHAHHEASSGASTLSSSFFNELL